MSIPEPPYDPDDTQPSYTTSHATMRRGRAVQERGGLPQWTLLVLMVISAASLVGTLALALSARQGGGLPQEAISVMLVLPGETRQIETLPVTVGVLLQQEGITLEAEDAISHPEETLLTEGMVITVNRARNVLLIVDGQQRTLRTPLNSPAEILASQNVEIRESDLVWVDGTPAQPQALADWPVPASEIEVRHSFTVTVRDGETETVIETTANTVGDALYEAGIEIFITDLVVPDANAQLSGDTLVTIDRAQPITIVVDGVTLTTRAQGGTVLDALTEAGVALVGLDYTIPTEDAPLEAGMTIRVLRVTEDISTFEEPIPYETAYQPDDSLPLDQQQVVQAGQNGTMVYEERVRYENGEEVGREPAGSYVGQEPVTQIIAYGTQITLRTVNTPEGSREYWRVLRMYATSYHPEALGGDDVTSIGERLRKGIVAANPNIIPYRTNLYVPGYGLGIMADTGGPRSTPYWVDLGYSDEDYVGWHEYVDVYLLTPVPQNIDYLLPSWSGIRGIPDS